MRDAYLYITSFLYAGDKYECPLCQGHFSKFLPMGLDVPVIEEKQIIGGGYKLNSMCPRCYSSERERLVYLYIIENSQAFFSSNIKLLHIAPERNLSKKLKSQLNIDYTSADLVSPLVDIKMDITDIEQPDETYDVIICNHVLEHILDDAKAMGELFRVLKKGGIAILQVPISYTIGATYEDTTVTSSEDRELVFGQDDHVRIYGKDYFSRLESAGFSVAARSYTEAGKLQDILKYGLDEEEKIFVCSKP
jgi:SAM-dependent methyltransferase